MRLVLMIYYSGDEECCGHTETYPLEFSSKDEAEFEILKCFELKKEREKQQTEYWDKVNSHHIKKPIMLNNMINPRDLNGKNPLLIEKRKNREEEYNEKLEKWYAEYPVRPTEWEEEIKLFGNEIDILELDNVKILTVEEWYGNQSN